VERSIPLAVVVVAVDFAVMIRGGYGRHHSGSRLCVAVKTSPAEQRKREANQLKKIAAPVLMRLV
jgi:hypothetical protein